MIVKCATYENGVRRGEDLPLSDACVAAEAENTFAWVGVFEPTPEEFASIAREFGLHELAVEDAVKAHQRPKAELYGDTLFVVVKTAQYVDSEEVIELGELMVFVNPSFIITVRHGEGELGAGPRADRAPPGAAAARPGMVLYAILDHVVDGYEVAAHGVDVDIQEVERQVFSGDGTNPAERIYKLEREVLDFHGAVAPLGARGRRDLPRPRSMSSPTSCTSTSATSHDHLRRVEAGSPPSASCSAAPCTPT